MPGATRGAGIVTPPRDANGIPGTPPLTTYGKSVFAWDDQQGTRPGGKAGNVLLNAHTWPDGSALGNRLLAALHLGDRLVVRGVAGRLCYKVTERVEVPADIQMYRYYAPRVRPDWRSWSAPGPASARACGRSAPSGSPRPCSVRDS